MSNVLLISLSILCTGKFVNTSYSKLRSSFNCKIPSSLDFIPSLSQSFALFKVRDAIKEDLPPGAAQASKISSLGFGSNAKTGK